MEIGELLDKRPEGIVAIDGELGAGKTKLSIRLSNKYKLPLIHLDDYLVPGKNEYVDSINMDKLANAINKEQSVVVEGICLLSILKKVGIEPNIHFFLYRYEVTPYKKGNALVSEVQNYINSTKADEIATKAFYMNNTPTNQLDVDIAYLKAKTTVSIMLSIGGIVSLLVGAYILGAGIKSTDSAVFEIFGAKITAKGIGAVILGSSVFWAYFAYLSRPKYSRRREKKYNVLPGGASEAYEFESSTMTTARQPGNNDDL